MEWITELLQQIAGAIDAWVATVDWREVFTMGGMWLAFFIPFTLLLIYLSQRSEKRRHKRRKESWH